MAPRPAPSGQKGLADSTPSESTEPRGDELAGRMRWSPAQKVARYTGAWNIGCTVRDLHRISRNQLRDLIAPHGVTTSIWYYLWALYEEDGISQKELARRVKNIGPTVVAALNLMERDGFVERRRCPRDRRNVNIFLTPKAKALRGAMAFQASAVNERSLRLLSDAEIDVLFELLERVKRGLQAEF
jgi:MarR family transcriptional regulator, organic hydroperoxide resistance regulator